MTSLYLHLTMFKECSEVSKRNELEAKGSDIAGTPQDLQQIFGFS